MKAIRVVVASGSREKTFLNLLMRSAKRLKLKLTRHPAGRAVWDNGAWEDDEDAD